MDKLRETILKMFQGTANEMVQAHVCPVCPVVPPSYVIKTAIHLARVTLYQYKGVDALQPELAAKCIKLMDTMRTLGKPVYLAQGYRSAAEQDATYAKGRNVPGDIVTYAQGLQSYHQYGLAMDLVFVQYGWSPPSSDWWKVLGDEGKKLGLIWGGDWDGLVDLPHFELHDGYTWHELITYFKK